MQPWGSQGFEPVNFWSLDDPLYPLRLKQQNKTFEDILLALGKSESKHFSNLLWVKQPYLKLLIGKTSVRLIGNDSNLKIAALN